jgi:hypothetical protein
LESDRRGIYSKNRFNISIFYFLESDRRGIKNKEDLHPQETYIPQGIEVISDGKKLTPGFEEKTRVISRTVQKLKDSLTHIWEVGQRIIWKGKLGTIVEALVQEYCCIELDDGDCHYPSSLELELAF